eukprot:Gb_05932 [translate_table: standard]
MAPLDNSVNSSSNPSRFENSRPLAHMPLRRCASVNVTVSDRKRLGDENIALHSQVARLRNENRHLADDIIEGVDISKDRLAILNLASQMEEIFLAAADRKRIPSPLGAKPRGHSVPIWNTRDA